MHRLTLTLAAMLLSATAAAKSTCKPPKIIGMDYHTARAVLIKAGCRPIPYSLEKNGGRPAPSDAAALGYIESDHPSSGIGGRNFTWHGFTVYSRCGDILDPTPPHCVVRSVHH